MLKNRNKTSYSCLNPNFKLVNLEEEKYAEIKKCLYEIDDVDDIDTVRKIEVFADQKTCKENCLKCRRYFDIESGYFETICDKTTNFYYFLCIGPFKNSFQQNGIVKQNTLILSVVLTVLVLTMMASALLCYHKFKRNTNPSMVSKVF